MIDTDLLAADLPPRISGMAAMNVIGHCSPADRAHLWALLGERLLLRGRAMLNLYPPHRPEAVTAAAIGDVTIGRRRYKATAGAPNQPAATA